ncbi:BrnA antitoxin family protein [Phyllobacterium ifriqiyense]
MRAKTNYDVIDKFKADGEGWQRKMNDALRNAAGA